MTMNNEINFLSRRIFVQLAGLTAAWEALFPSALPLSLVRSFLL
jgi:hypothetical protein